MATFLISNLPQVASVIKTVDLFSFGNVTGKGFTESIGDFGAEEHRLQSLAANVSTSLSVRTGTITLPPAYVPGSAVSLDIDAGMDVVAFVSADLDVEAYSKGADGKLSGADLNSTAAQTINATAFATKSFSIDGTGLVAGDRLLVAVSVSLDDTGGAAGNKFGFLADARLSITTYGGL